MGGTTPPGNGTIALEQCANPFTAFPPGTTLPATVAPTETPGLCGGNPTLPAYVGTLPLCVCVCACV